MTFDEAIEKVEQLANFEVGKTTGNIRRDFKLEIGDVRDILTGLREEYAPTVEMTAKEKGNFLSIATSSVTFTNFHEQVLKQSTNIKLGIQASPELYKHLSEKELMQAWLYPETIKVVDE